MHQPFIVHVSPSAIDVVLLHTDLDDGAAHTLAAHLEPLAEQAVAGTLRLDLGRVRRLTSIILGKVVALHHRVKSAGGHFQVVNLCRELYELFRLGRLHTFVDLRMA